jgi:hypothetical protein
VSGCEVREAVVASVLDGGEVVGFEGVVFGGGLVAYPASGFAGEDDGAVEEVELVVVGVGAFACRAAGRRAWAAACDACAEDVAACAVAEVWAEACGVELVELGGCDAVSGHEKTRRGGCEVMACA